MENLHLAIKSVCNVVLDDRVLEQILVDMAKSGTLVLHNFAAVSKVCEQYGRTSLDYRTVLKYIEMREEAAYLSKGV